MKHISRYFQCARCGGTHVQNSDEQRHPSCCGTFMDRVELLPSCERTVTAEHASFIHSDAPCDDATGKQ